MCAAVENALALLGSHKRSKLSKENQLTYDVLESYLTSSLEQFQYALYEEPLAPLTGTQAQLPILLSEFRFYDKEDVDIYLKLLAQTPEYFQSILAFEQEKSKQGLFMSESRADTIITECETFINLQANNYLYSSFESRIDDLHLSEGDKAVYIKKNEDYIAQYLLPAYKELKDGLQKLRTTGTNNGGLCNLPKGAHYYEAVVNTETGSSRSIPELQKLTRNQITEDFTMLQKTITSSADMDTTQKITLKDSNPVSILSSLQSKLKGIFPKPPKVNTEIKYVEKIHGGILKPGLLYDSGY